MKSKFIIFSSITYALKAKSELEKNKIWCTVEKIKGQTLQNGCIYAIKVKSNKIAQSVRIIKNADIAIIDIIDDQNKAL